MLIDIFKDIQIFLGKACRLGNLNHANPGDAKYGVYISLLSLNENSSLKNVIVNKKNISEALLNQRHWDLHISITAFFEEYEDCLKALDDVMFKFLNQNNFKIKDRAITYNIQLTNLSLDQNIALTNTLVRPLPQLVYKITATIET